MLLHRNNISSKKFLSLIPPLILLSYVGLTSCSNSKYDIAVSNHIKRAEEHDAMMNRRGGKPTRIENRIDALEKRFDSNIVGAVGVELLENLDNFLKKTKTLNPQVGLGTIYASPPEKTFYGGMVSDNNNMLLFQNTRLPTIYHEFAHLLHINIDGTRLGTQFWTEWAEISQPEYHNQKSLDLMPGSESKLVFDEASLNYVPKDGCETYYAKKNKKEHFAVAVEKYCTSPEKLQLHTRTEREKQITSDQLDFCLRWSAITKPQ